MPKNTSWDPKTAVFTWQTGSVTLPPGFTYQVDQGTDTFVGHFTSPDGRVILYHDIGWYAGAYASRTNAQEFHEHLQSGARVWTASKSSNEASRTMRYATTFPDSECANFILKSTNPAGFDQIESIARSYRPTGVVNTANPCQNEP